MNVSNMQGHSICISIPNYSTVRNLTLTKVQIDSFTMTNTEKEAPFDAGNLTKWF